MYNQNKFIEILKKCQSNTSLNEFARLSGVDAGYLSRIINKKKINPPSPKILEKISKASRGITSYEELMEVCGYVNLKDIYMQPIEKNINCIPLLYKLDTSQPDFLNENYIIDYIPFYTKDKNIDNYFAYEINDDSLLPILGQEDIIILSKQNTFEDMHIFLISLDSNLILIRKIVKKDSGIQLQSINPYYPVINLTEEEMKSRNFMVLGKVIKAEITSVFK